MHEETGRRLREPSGVALSPLGRTVRRLIRISRSKGPTFPKEASGPWFQGLAGGQDMHHLHQLSAGMQKCISECQSCHQECLQTAMGHCLETGGRHVEPGHFRLMIGCAEICRTAAALMLGQVPHHAAVCGACADICEACAASCESIGGMESCVEACRRCAASCRAMAASMGSSSSAKVGSHAGAQH